MIILHGDNLINSRARLVELIAELKSSGLTIQSFAAKSLTPAQLEEELGGTSLFGEEQAVVIEELHSLPTSARKKQLIELAANSQIQTVLWEKRLLTATMLKKFPQAKVEAFKASNLLFSWLDKLGSRTSKQQLISDLHQIIESDSAFFCFTMISRQVRLLISSIDDGKVKAAPFVQAKLRKQAQNFSLQGLLKLHQKLVEIDYKQKRSLSKLTLEQELDLLVLSL